MEFGKCDWKTKEQGQERCFLAVNGLGGYSSLSLLASNTRNDHALFMGCLTAPNCRFHYISNVHEELCMNGRVYKLATQDYVTSTKNTTGYEYLQLVTQDGYPEWSYQIEDVEIAKQIVLVYGENTVGIRYKINSASQKNVTLNVKPLLRFTAKDEQINRNQRYEINKSFIRSNHQCLYYQTNGQTDIVKKQIISDLYFEHDSRDGRDAVGTAVINHVISMEMKKEEQELFIIYSDQKKEHDIGKLFDDEIRRQFILQDEAKLTNTAARQLVYAANQFISKRESTAGYTIIAGYPFFSDWGRDTMIAMLGCTISTKQYGIARSILETFQSYCRNGVMPNVFPEKNAEPIYNTADASLLFINAVYEYYKATKDKKLVDEMYSTMQEIVNYYCQGTDNHIYMDSDGLISAGDDKEQVTWMDVRIEDYLPTPRHGKPVEINAYWYNALCIMQEITKWKNKEDNQYLKLSQKVKHSFLLKFWNNNNKCLRDVISGTKADDQIRCNQIWALSMPFTMLSEEQAQQILKIVHEELYTPYGLRSLSMKDEEFIGYCKGSQRDRDMAYHQGTVWVFPLGAYLLSVLRWSGEGERQKALQCVKNKLRKFETCLSEGCVGQVAEIYDGINPNESRGCYGQAWSVGEMLRVYEKVEMMEKGEL